MRLTIFAMMFAAATSAQAQTTSVDCLIIDGLDTLHAVQTRLSRGNNDFMFQTDVRVIRAEFSMLNEITTLSAIESNRLAAKGSAFIQFLRNTSALLQAVSLDDPNSIRPHFTQAVRTNLFEIGQHLGELRCLDTQVSRAERESARTASPSTEDDSEDDDAVQILREAAEEVLSLTNLFIFVGIATSAVVGRHLLQQFIKRQKRRAKRHPVTYPSAYELDENVSDGMMIDVNCFGCKLKHVEDTPIAKGTSIKIQIEEDWIEGSIVWTNNHYAGVQFKRPVSLETVKTVCETPDKKNGAQKDAA